MSWSDDKELLLGAYAQNNRGNVLKKLWGIETCYIKKKDVTFTTFLQQITGG